jgi:sortase A
MKNSLILVSLFFALVGFALLPQTESHAQYTPQVPDTGEISVEVPDAPAPPQPVVEEEKIITPSHKESSYPIRLQIPAISLNSSIQNEGVTSDGEMDVPSGSTKNVGWYQPGTIPGDVGSAVIGAHVYAAFSKLRYLKAGSNIYVEAADHTTLHFVVKKVATYKLSELSAEELFNRTDGKHLNLITCAGTFVRSSGTYDHRLVVWADLVE